SYVFTASNQFLTTLNTIVKGLNRAGFSSKDCRQIEAPPAPPDQSGTPQHTQSDRFQFEVPTDEVSAATNDGNEPEEEIDLSRISLSGEATDVLSDETGESPDPAVQAIKQILEQAMQANTVYESQINAEDPEQA